MKTLKYYAFALSVLNFATIVCTHTNSEEWQYIVPLAPEEGYVVIDIGDQDQSIIQSTELRYPNSFIFQDIEARKQYLAPLTAIAEQSEPLTKKQIAQLRNFCNNDGYRTCQLATFAYKRLQRNDKRAVIALLQNVCLNKVLNHACRERHDALIPICLEFGATNIEENIALLLCRDGQDALNAIKLLTTRPWSAQKTLQYVQQWSQYTIAKTTFATHYFTHMHDDGKLHHIQYAFDFLSQYI